MSLVSFAQPKLIVVNIRATKVYIVYLPFLSHMEKLYERIHVAGNIVDLEKKQIFPGIITINNGKILSVKHSTKDIPQQYILPGFIDAHVHIESSMLVPAEFARLAVAHGTVATVSDPHEIGNVLGLKGIKYMIQNGLLVLFIFILELPPVFLRQFSKRQGQPFLRMILDYYLSRKS